MSRRLLGLMVLMLGAALWVGQVWATDKGKTLSYRGGGEGKVAFDGRTHAGKGFVCNDCHLELFPTRKKGFITMDGHEKGNGCFTCHNGVKAFKECTACHRKL
jgi:phosphate transport system substrate-binding protein